MSEDEERDYLTEYLALMKGEKAYLAIPKDGGAGDLATIRMDDEAGVYLAKEHVNRLERIEAKLDEVLRLLRTAT